MDGIRILMIQRLVEQLAKLDALKLLTWLLYNHDQISSQGSSDTVTK